MSTEAWNPEDEPATREEALAYERFLRVLNHEEGGKVPEALSRKYINVMLDPAFAKKHPRTHARMLERYHSMNQKDRHMAIKQGWVEEAQKKEQPPWSIHIHSATDASALGVTFAPCVDPSLHHDELYTDVGEDHDQDDPAEEDTCPSP